MYLARKDEWKPEKQAIILDPTDKRTIGRLKTRRKLIAKGRKRIVRVPDDLVPVMNDLATKALPSGHLFYSENRQPWDTPSKPVKDGAKPKRVSRVAHRMNKLIERVNGHFGRTAIRVDVTLYSYRHAFVTRWLKANRNPMKLCELIDTSLDMLHKHYSHLFEDHIDLLAELNDFTAGSGSEARRRSPSESGTA
ncbi:MAG: hypothetical protein K2R98_19080 [Gemmataceae bacterium]|nr:hypothetical protein [Gemmataceae bacterium]